MRKFEKISFEQFKKDIKDDKELYASYSLPKRSTKNSAGYDFEALYDYTLKPGEIMKIPTGVKVVMESDDVLFLIDRSSMGFKYNIRMCNQVGVIDADYYNSDNEGHMWIKIQNEGDKDYIVKKGDAMIQGIFIKYLKTDDDIESNVERNGGIGSTNK
ncbi:MAG: deoxyuridine 5'-triphosphate nucleotidohydrolase [Bacilli bacterium]|nr:deoxyuridine 5'-triphosphate nucleotidohydrolase [Bacilli bacterium]